MTFNYGNPLLITWNAQGDISNPTAQSTPITFSYDGIKPGGAEGRPVTVSITDANGYAAKSAIEIRLFTHNPCRSGEEWHAGTCVPIPRTPSCPGGWMYERETGQCVRIMLK